MLVTAFHFQFSKRKYLFILICLDFSMLAITQGAQLRQDLQQIRNAKNQGLLESSRIHILEIVVVENQGYFMFCTETVRTILWGYLKTTKTKDYNLSLKAQCVMKLFETMYNIICTYCTEVKDWKKPPESSTPFFAITEYAVGQLLLAILQGSPRAGQLC